MITKTVTDMKKLFFLLVVMFMGTASRAQTYHFDVNNDGEIELTDALLIIDYILGRFNPEDNNPPQSHLACPDDHHPHLIDLGLPSGTKWACCNVDTDHPENQSPTNYGGYYAWGKTVTKSTYSWESYTHCDGSSSSCHDLGSDIAGTKYDVAHVKWGGSWVMPSRAQQDELRDNCTYEWTTENGVKGGKFTGKNGGSIFLPAAGGRNYSDLINAGSGGGYWSSAQNPSYANRAYYLYFGSDGTSADYYFRYNGFTVRPVSRN